MPERPEQARAARRLLTRQSVGVLCTNSVDVEGYPFGSITPFVLNYMGEPAILISDIAQHTRNIRRDNRVSLIVFDRFADDPQEGPRLTWIGNAEPVAPEDVRTRDRYLRYFPSAESYFETHDFSFYSIRLLKGRFIGGFGQIYWVEPEAMLERNPFRETEPAIISHMNEDHRDSLKHYCRVLKGIQADEVTMIGIDGEGFDLLAGPRKLRIDFEAPVGTLEEARAVLVKLARI